MENMKESHNDIENTVENMTDPEASAIFKAAFYAEGKTLEEEAMRSSFVEDEEKKEALRLRILAAAGRSEGEAKAEKSAREAVAAESINPEAKAMAAENINLEAKAMADETAAQEDNVGFEKVITLGKRVKDTATAVDAQNPLTENVLKEAVNTSETPEKKKKRKFTPLVRWAAVLILVCAGVFGASMTSQAKGSGLWSSIQRLIGIETRWEQDDNGEDRNISDPEEYKAIEEIQEKLGINIPKFFYWPDEWIFEDVNIIKEPNSFILAYSDGKHFVFFEGWLGDNNTSSNNAWQGEGEEKHIEYDGISYTITETNDEKEDGKRYYVRWTNGEIKYALSGMDDLDEVKKILKNIKN